jgi:uncharacterized protein (UPF0332 family)
MSSSPSASFDPVEFYKFSGKIYQEHSGEIIYRVIVGRAYYSAFLCAKEFAGIGSSGADVHTKVIEHFKSNNKTISNQLKSLKDLRHRADYVLNNSIEKRDAGESLRLAKGILTTLNYLY